MAKRKKAKTAAEKTAKKTKRKGRQEAEVIAPFSAIVTGPATFSARHPRARHRRLHVRSRGRRRDSIRSSDALGLSGFWLLLRPGEFRALVSDRNLLTLNFAGGALAYG